MRTHPYCAKVALFVLTTLNGANVGAQETQWTLRTSGLYSAISSDQSVSIQNLSPPLGQDTTTHSVADGPGFGVGLEYMWSKRIGIEFAALLTSHDSEVVISNDLGTFAATDSMGLRTFTLGANYYFPTKGRAQWSIGGFVPLMFSDDTNHSFVALGRNEVLRFDQDYGVGVKAGMDLPFAPGSPWILSIEGRYQFLILESEEPGGDLDVNPAILSVGVGYQF